MTDLQWKYFCDFKNSFKKQCEIWQKQADKLIPLQIEASKKDTPSYPIENPVVYNTALDELTKDSEIKLIVIGDNPGKSEQLSINKKYLVGQAGKIATSFFKNNPELNTDFRQHVIILNKTPVHSAKTKHLTQIEKELAESNSPLKNIILESQIWMAKETAELHKNLIEAAEKENGIQPELWLVGYAELKKNGIFVPYRDTLKTQYDGTDFWNKVFVFQHFSMNRFTIDLKDHQSENGSLTLIEQIHKLGIFHKNEIFC